MNGHGKELTTPNPRAVPSSAVKNVEESRQQRLQRQQSRFRDRGGRHTTGAKGSVSIEDKTVALKVVFTPEATSESDSWKGEEGLSCFIHCVDNGKHFCWLVHATKSSRNTREGASTPDPGPAPRSRKAEKSSTITGNEEDDEPVKKPGKKATRKPRTACTPKASKPTKAAGKAKQDTARAPESSTSRASSTAVNSDDDDPPIPPKSRGRNARKPKSKGLDEATDGEAPLTSPLPDSKVKSMKRKLSIVQEEDEDENSLKIEARSQKPNLPLSSPEPVKKRARTTTAPGEVDSEVPKPKKAAPAKGKGRGKATAKTKPPPEEGILPSVPSPPPSPEPPKKKNKFPKSVLEPPDSSVETPEPSTKPTSSKARTTGKAKPSDEPKASDTSTSKARGKRPAASQPAETERSKKKAKTLPLQEVDEHQAISAEKATQSKKSQKRAVRRSKLQKENTPVSDTSEGRTAQNRSRTKSRTSIKGPRKSVMIRMREPLPPIEDNDPDPIDFLS